MKCYTIDCSHKEIEDELTNLFGSPRFLHNRMVWEMGGITCYLEQFGNRSVSWELNVIRGNKYYSICRDNYQYYLGSPLLGNPFKKLELRFLNRFFSNIAPKNTVKSADI